MKQYLLYICAATLSVACSKSNGTLDTTLSSDKVSFAANISVKEDDWASSATRGPVTDGKTIADFGVFCYHTDLQPWNNVSSSALPNKMFNVKVSRDNADKDIWAYGTPVEWNGGDGSYFTFFGYSPYATAGSGIVAPTTGVAGAPILGFTVLDAVGSQVDMLVAQPVYNTVPVAKVKMQFKHVLSRIGFKAFSITPGIKVVKIEITGVKHKANLTLDGNWNTTSDTKGFAITYDTPVVIPTTALAEKTAIDLTGAANGFLMLPQDMQSNTSAKIVFTYAIADGAPLTKEYIIKEEWTKNTFVTYIVDLTTNLEATLNVTTVSITQWGDGGTISGDVDGEVTE